MSTFRDWKVVNKLSDRGQTNSEVHLLQKKDSDEFIVRKVIHGIDHPLYQAIFKINYSNLFTRLGYRG